jgi:hypothetical protein
MMQTEIKIVQYNVSGQVIASYDLDLFDDISIPVNKSIIDVKEPEKRKSDYTLPIRVPATSNNKDIFSNIQNLNRSTRNTTSTNYNPDFNVNLKSEALVIRSGVILMRGYLQLTEIPINDEEVQFELVIIGKLANLFQDLGDKKLAEINLTEYNHAWNYSNIANSWGNYIQKNGITYNNFDVSGNPLGEGYVYPLIDNGLSTLINNQAAELEYELEKTMYPAIYVKQILDKIFSEAGYRYQSNFFNSVIFKRLIIPFTGGAFTASESAINDKTFKVENIYQLTYTTTNISAASDIKRYTFDEIMQNTSPTSVDRSNYKIDINASTSGEATFNFKGEVAFKNNSASTFRSVWDSFLVVRFVVVSGGIRKISEVSIDYNLGSLANLAIVSKNLNINSGLMYCENTDDAFLEFYWYVFGDPNAGFYGNPSDISVIIQPRSSFSNSPSSKYTEGNTINIGSALPKEVKQKDFLTWIFRAFNLYAIPDSIDANKLIIEPRDDFYTNEVVDITNNLDTSSEIMVKPMGVLDFRDFVLKYKEDKDEYNSKYQDLFGEPYSTKRLSIDNDFLTQTNTVEVGFSASPLSNTNGQHDRIYTKIRKIDPNTNNSELPSYNIRMLIYGGLVATNIGWKLNTRLGGIINYEADFPYAGMLDSTSNPTYDLGFSQPKAIYYGLGSTTYTNGNLFNRYWKKTIEEITDKDSKIITAKFKFNEVEFNALSFRKIYFLNKQYYRLYTVQHNLNSDDLVTVELLKLKTAPTFELSITTGNGGSGGVLADEDLPMFVRADNTEFFQSQANTQFRTKGATEDIVLLRFGSDINFLENGVEDAYLPDASLIPLLTGDPIIIVKNITSGGSVKIYPINSSNLINGGSDYTLTVYTCVWFVAYKGNWQLLNTVATGGG